MDDLSFRKAIYAQPFTKDPKVIEAARKDPKKQAFWEEVKKMEFELQEAMHVPVPESLAEKLILRQSLDSHRKGKRKQPWYLALAASVVFVAVLSAVLLNQGRGNLQADVFSHMSHVGYEVMKGSQVNIDIINDKLAIFNGSIEQDIGEVISANYCYLNTIKSLHLIIKGETGLTSMFVIPNSLSDSLSNSFSNAKYKGASFNIDSAKVIIVSDSTEAVTDMQQRAKKALSFSA